MIDFVHLPYVAPSVSVQTIVPPAVLCTSNDEYYGWPNPFDPNSD